MENKFLAIIYDTEGNTRELIINAESFDEATTELDNFIDYRYVDDEFDRYIVYDLSLIEEI